MTGGYLMFVCLFAKWLGALYFPCRFLFSVWSAGGRRLLLVKQAQMCCDATFANPPAKRKQAPDANIFEYKVRTVG